MNRRFTGGISRKTPAGGSGSALIRAATAAAATMSGSGVGQDHRLRREIQRRERSQLVRDADRARTRRTRARTLRQPPPAAAGADVDVAAAVIPSPITMPLLNPAPVAVARIAAAPLMPPPDAVGKQRAMTFTRALLAARKRGDRFYEKRCGAAASTTTDCARTMPDDVDVVLHFDSATGVRRAGAPERRCMTRREHAAAMLHATATTRGDAAAPPAVATVYDGGDILYLPDDAVRAFAVHANLWTRCAACGDAVRTVDVHHVEASYPGYRAFHWACW